MAGRGCRSRILIAGATCFGIALSLAFGGNSAVADVPSAPTASPPPSAAPGPETSAPAPSPTASVAPFDSAPAEPAPSTSVRVTLFRAPDAVSAPSQYTRATVRLVALVNGVATPADGDPVLSVPTDGVFTFTGVDTSRIYTVLATPTLQPTFYPPTYLGDTRDPAEAETVPFDAAAPVAVTITVHALPSVTGVVLQPNGVPVPGTTITATSYGAAGTPQAGQVTYSSSVTGQSFQFVDLAPGDYVITSHDPDSEYADTGYSTANTLRPAVPVHVADDGIHNIVLNTARSGSISGVSSVGGAASQWNARGAGTAFLWLSSGGTWSKTSRSAPIAADGAYAFLGLSPDTYRVSVEYTVDGTVTTRSSNDLVVTAGANLSYDPAIGAAASAPMVPGTLVKSPISPQIYLVDGWTRLIPVATFASTSDAGFGTAFTVVPVSSLSGRTLASTPLSNLLSCGGRRYLATGGSLLPLGVDQAAGAVYTALDASTCSALPRTQGLSGVILLSSRSNGAVWELTADGTKRHILSPSTVTRLTGGAWLTYPVNDFFLSVLTTGASVLPFGQLVKTTSSPQIYLADDTDKLIPVTSFGYPAAFGIPTSFLTLAPNEIDGLTVAAHAMTSIVTCPYNLGAYLGGTSAGTPGPVTLDPKIALALPSTPVSDALCSSLQQRARPQVNADVQAAGDPAVYRLTTAGTKRHVLSASQLAPGIPVPIVDAGMLNAVPRGTDVVSAGMLVKRASSPMVYIDDGSGGAIPVSRFDTTADLGLGTAFYVVTDATLDAMTAGTQPMTDAYSCKESDGTEVPMIGVQGKRRAIDTMGGIPHLLVPRSLCVVLYATYGGGPVLLRSTSSPAVYQLLGGQKHWILNGSALARITGGDPTALILQPNDAFLGSIPTGSPIS